MPTTARPAPEEGISVGQDVVLTLSRETLADMAARAYMRPPDRLLLTLLRSPRVRRLLIAEPYRSRLVSVVRGERPVALPPSDGAERYLLSPHRLRRADPVSPLLLRASYRRYEATLRAAAGRVGIGRPVVITTYPLLAGFGDFSWAGSVTYFARDDWATYPPLRRWHPAFRRAYAEIRRRRRPVMAVSASLLERIDPTGGALVVRNGVDPAEWEQPPEPPEWLRRLPRPWCVYAGTVDDRLDVEMVASLASVATVVLAGPIKDEAHIARLRALPSVHLPGHQPRPKISGLVAAADVCLLPHRRTPLTEAMDPIKLYEYLAAGRPVLATDLTPVRALGQRVRLLRPGDDVVAALRETLGWPVVEERERLAFIERNSWAARHVALLDFVLGEDHSRLDDHALPGRG